MRKTVCECGHDEGTHFPDVKPLYMPDGSTVMTSFRGRCLGMGCDDPKGRALCSCYRPDKDSEGHVPRGEGVLYPRVNALIKGAY